MKLHFRLFSSVCILAMSSAAHAGFIATDLPASPTQQQGSAPTECHPITLTTLSDPATSIICQVSNILKPQPTAAIAVPEPSSLALFAAGFLGLAIRRKIRKNSA